MDMMSHVCRVPGCVEGPERARHFLRLWTLKEAYVKAVGHGIGAQTGLRAFSVVLKPSSNGTPLQTHAFGDFPCPRSLAAMARPCKPACRPSLCA